MRQFLRGKIHGVRVTSARVDYMGSFGIDADFMKQIGLLPYESIDVYNVSNGERLRTYAIELPAGSRRFESNGAAAHLIREGDRVILAAYTWLNDIELSRFEGPKVLIVGEDNEPKTFHNPSTLFISDSTGSQLPA